MIYVNTRCYVLLVYHYNYTENVQNIPSLGGFLRYTCGKALKFDNSRLNPQKTLRVKMCEKAVKSPWKCVKRPWKARENWAPTCRIFSDIFLVKNHGRDCRAEPVHAADGIKVIHVDSPEGYSLGGLMANDIISDVRKRALARAAKVSKAMELNKYQSQL